MLELQVPTRTITVHVCDTSGRWTWGDLFVPASGYPELPAAALLWVLNDERTFLPFAAGGGTLVLNKLGLLRVRLEGNGNQGSRGPHAGELDSEPGPVVPERPSTAILGDGSRVTGWVAVETPKSMSRLVDKLNQVQRFLPLRTTEGWDFIQVMQIMSME